MRRFRWVFVILLLVLFCAGCTADGGSTAPADTTAAPMQTAQPDVIRTVYEPETSLIAPPSVVLKVDTQNQYQLLGSARPPQAAWFTVDETGRDIIVGDEQVSLADVFAACYGKIIPVFELKTVLAAQELQSFSKQSRTTDFLVVSDDAEILKEIALTGVRKGLITRETGETCARQVHEAGADIAVLASATREEAEYLQLRFIAVMLMPDSDADTAVHAALDCGANHVVLSDCEVAYKLYEAITGEPQFVRSPFIAAHGGIVSLAPENSVEGFLEAVKAGADAVECDVFLAADGHVAIHHDDSLKDSTVEKADVPVEALTREELKAYTLNTVGAYSDSKIVFLDEFFALMKDRSVHLIIEIKSENPQCVSAIRSLAEEYEMLDHINIISFHASQVAYSREMMPEVGASLIVNVGNNPADKLLRSAYSQTDGINGAYSPNHGFSAEGVRAMQHRGMLVNLWTVDGPEDMLEAARKGITVLTTNTAMNRIFVDLETAKIDSESLFGE